MGGGPDTGRVVSGRTRRDCCRACWRREEGNDEDEEPLLQEAGGNSLTQHPVEKQMKNLTALRQKLVFTMEAHTVGPDRAVNIDETAVRLLPTSSFGWSTEGEKSAQLQSGTAVVTATVAVTMAEETPAWLQVFFEGKTHSVIPEATLDRLQFACFTSPQEQRRNGSHWTDACSKCGKLTHAANERLAEIALGPEPLTESFDFSLPSLKLYSVTCRHRYYAGSHRLPEKRVEALDVGEPPGVRGLVQ